MPNGSSKPVANVETDCALPCASTPRTTRMRPGSLSATNRSPLGARRTSRGLVSPAAYSFTEKPDGACGQALAGRGTRFGPLSTDSGSLGAGRSAAVILRTTPGCWRVKSVKAAFPVITRAEGSRPAMVGIATTAVTQVARAGTRYLAERKDIGIQSP